MSWKQLDNAAKIFPVNTNKQDTKVFRFSCTLKEEINKEVLQEALNETMREFPMYNSILRKGLFWYYLETSSIKPQVTKECYAPCSPIYHKYEKKLLFEVTYYKKRINLEIHHALADGAGALQFLCSLVLNYLVKMHTDMLEGKQKLTTIYDASLAEREIDGFQKYFLKEKGHYRQTNVKAYQFKGERIDENFLQVINGRAPVKAVLDLSHQYQTTLTIYLVAILIWSIGQQMSEREKKQPVVVSVPVNLRQYFQSASARNFFSVVLVPYYFGKGNDTLDAIIYYLKVFFKKEFKTEKFQARINWLVSLERNYLTRAIPLILKKPTLKIAHYFNNEAVTTSFSNVGKVEMPDLLKPYIEGFDMCVSTRKIQICLCSYGDTLSMSFTSSFRNTEVQKYFFRKLKEQGVPIVIHTNYYESEDIK